MRIRWFDGTEGAGGWGGEGAAVAGGKEEGLRKKKRSMGVMLWLDLDLQIGQTVGRSHGLAIDLLGSHLLIIIE